jgi:hypothetical protein
MIGNEGKIRIGAQDQATRETWLETALRNISAFIRVLDAGAGEQQCRRFRQHLDYVSQDLAQYHWQGDSVGLHIRARQGTQQEN